MDALTRMTAMNFAMRRRDVNRDHAGETRLTFEDPRSAVVCWHPRLTAAREFLMRAARSMGRIEVMELRLEWLGSGWLVAPDTILGGSGRCGSKAVGWRRQPCAEERSAVRLAFERTNG